jgi:hypothetical protein
MVPLEKMAKRVKQGTYLYTVLCICTLCFCEALSRHMLSKWPLRGGSSVLLALHRIAVTSLLPLTLVLIVALLLVRTAQKLTMFTTLCTATLLLLQQAGL